MSKGGQAIEGLEAGNSEMSLFRSAIRVSMLEHGFCCGSRERNVQSAR